MNEVYEIGDLVRLKDSYDKVRQLGFVVGISPRLVHIKSQGETQVVQVYWPQIDDYDWEYSFFLEKLKPDSLTRDD